MSYLVLARKWRPKRFAELVGQEHVVRALTNALATGRVHHAFLFTGTRGVGKTTIARIFAKSLNCERGESADPCGVCQTCQDIDAGRYIDLLEIDAASNTGVDDVRELIDNAQYSPARGRVKVYLIDEVHMLSKSAFNALLKTLEEPPGHVKFLLATTDPQKLPVTVLSRCLQFNLKRLEVEQIEGQMAKILLAEAIPFDAPALRALARAADGSLRDGLSLLDQAIAYAGGELTESAVAAMLGSVDRARVGALLNALGTNDAAAVMAEVEALALFSPDYSDVLESLAAGLHQVQLRQLVPGAEQDADALELDTLATALRPEAVQLWYQMALDGRRDLPWAPSARAGFEMVLLRMLAFHPAGSNAVAEAMQVDSAHPRNSTVTSGAQAARAALRQAAPAARSNAAPASRVATPAAEPVVAVGPPAAPPQSGATHHPVSSPVVETPATEPTPANEPPTPAVAPAAATVSRAPVSADDWPGLIATAGLRGLVRELGANAALLEQHSERLVLALPAALEHLARPALCAQLGQQLAARLSFTPRIEVRLQDGMTADSLRQRDVRARDARQQAAEAAFLGDADVQRLIAQGARLVPGSIQPLED